jgi:Nucleotide modification associated domain 3
MKIALLRVGIDTGSGGIHGPLLDSGGFEYIPIPDRFRKRGVSSLNYGNAVGRHGRRLVEYFPQGRQAKAAKTRVHYDPEFETFTYGDPTAPKRGLRFLEKGDLLVFYAGLKPWPTGGEPHLYIIGYFEVLMAGLACSFSTSVLREHFANNFHVHYPTVFEGQKQRLVLVKGGRGSRLLRRPCRISSLSADSAGRPLKVLSPEMRTKFGDLGGRLSIQRSPTRWVESNFVKRAAKFVRSLPDR